MTYLVFGVQRAFLGADGDKGRMANLALGGIISSWGTFVLCSGTYINMADSLIVGRYKQGNCYLFIPYV